MRRILLLSDVHLTSDEKAPVTGYFLDFLHGIDAAQVSSLYILGDLFDAWIGDDDDTAVAGQVQKALKALTEGGVAVFIQKGNRDFMLGIRFMNRCAATLLPTAYPLDSGDERWLLMHGDSLVTDAAYLRYRRRIRHPLTLAAASLLPLAMRRKLAAKMRAASRGEEINAVIDDARAAAALRQHGCRRLLHGHLHKSGEYAWEAAGETYQRWCLPAWDNGGGYAEISAGKLQLKAVGE